MSLCWSRSASRRRSSASRSANVSGSSGDLAAALRCRFCETCEQLHAGIIQPPPLTRWPQQLGSTPSVPISLGVALVCPACWSENATWQALLCNTASRGHKPLQLSWRRMPPAKGITMKCTDRATPHDKPCEGYTRSCRRQS